MNSRILKSQSRFVLSAQYVYGNATLYNRASQDRAAAFAEPKNKELVVGESLGSQESKSTVGRVPAENTAYSPKPEGKRKEKKRKK